MRPSIPCSSCVNHNGNAVRELVKVAGHLQQLQPLCGAAAAVQNLRSSVMSSARGYGGATRGGACQKLRLVHPALEPVGNGVHGREHRGLLPGGQPLACRGYLNPDRSETLQHTAAGSAVEQEAALEERAAVIQLPDDAVELAEVASAVDDPHALARRAHGQQ